jgi:hypothetical protein
VIDISDLSQEAALDVLQANNARRRESALATMRGSIKRLAFGELIEKKYIDGMNYAFHVTGDIGDEEFLNFKAEIATAEKNSRDERRKANQTKLMENRCDSTQSRGIVDRRRTDVRR